MSEFADKIIARYRKAWTCPILVFSTTEALEFEASLVALWKIVNTYNEYHRAEIILDGLYQRFGYPELAP